jgi:hypothetical protein
LAKHGDVAHDPHHPITDFDPIDHGADIGLPRMARPNRSTTSGLNALGPQPAAGFERCFGAVPFGFQAADPLARDASRCNAAIRRPASEAFAVRGRAGVVAVDGATLPGAGVQGHGVVAIRTD